MEQRRKSDECLRYAIFGDEHTKVSRTVEELDRNVCSIANAKLKCVADIGRCLKPFPRHLVLMLTKSVKKLIREICGSTAGKLLYVESLKCVKDEEGRMTLIRFFDKSSAMVTQVVNSTSLNNLLPSMCCVFHKIMQKVKPAISGLCENSE